MNYITRLRLEAAENQAAVNAAHSEIADFLAYLHSDKFAGVDTDGARKDWMSTADIFARLQNIRSFMPAAREIEADRSDVVR